MTAIELSPHIAPGEELIRLTNNFGADEANLEGVSYRPDHRGAFWIPRQLVTPELRNIGGFVERPIAKAESLQDIATHIGLMAKCRERDVLEAALVSLCEAVDTPDA